MPRLAKPSSDLSSPGATQNHPRPDEAAIHPEEDAYSDPVSRWHESFRDSEVIARPLGFFFREFERLGHSTDLLLADISLTREQLTSRHGRIDWDTMRTLMRNVGRVWDDDELIEAGKRMANSKWIRPVGLVARLLYSAKELYRWNFRPMIGGSAQFFSCIENSLIEHSPGRITVDTWMAPGYEPAPELYRIFQGALIQMPRVVGLKQAEVEFFDPGDGTVRYEIRFQTGGGLLAGLRRALIQPFLARSAARELEQVNDLLFERYGDIARQARKLSEATAALRESDERFRKAFNSAPSAIIVTHFDGEIVDINEIFINASGYGRDELIGHNTSEFGFWKDPGLRERLIATLGSGQTVRGVEVELVTRSGDTRFTLLSAAPTTLGGEPCAIWNAVDITERKQAAEENRRLQERIIQAQKLESLGVMAGGIAHDFNNLLVGMQGNAEMSLRELDAGGKPSRETLEAVLLAAQRAADLTKEMLASAGQAKSGSEPIELTALVAETATLLRSGLPKRVKLDYKLGAGPLWVEGDPTQLRQVVMNMMTNAAESFGDASGQVNIRTGLIDADRELLDNTYLDNDLPAGRYAAIEVADSGCGMDEQTLRRIFDPFFTTKFAGRGLGLAATLGIVRSHDGTLQVESDESRGTCFRVFFPLTEARPSEQLAAAPCPAIRGSVLVVDDEALVRRVALKMLEQIGYDAFEADDGESALALLREHGDSLVAVVLDLTMPGMSGDETFRELRKLAPELPVLCCTGHGAEVAAKWLENKGHVGFIAKPFQMQDMREALAALSQPIALA